MEHIIVSNVWKHLHKHDSILHFQREFQSGLSCESQLTETVHAWMNALDNKTPIYAILLDVTKAYDKVPHRRLLSKLTPCWIIGNTNNWITYILSNRKNRLMEPCRTSNMLHLVSHRAQFWHIMYTLLDVHQRHQRTLSIEYPPLCGLYHYISQSKFKHRS